MANGILSQKPCCPMRNNEEKRFQPSRSLRCIFILPRYIFHRRYRLENSARPAIVDASLRRKNVAATPSLLTRNSTDARNTATRAHRTPICTVVHKTDGIPPSGHRLPLHTPLKQTLCVCIERWRLIPALQANIFAFHVPGSIDSLVWSMKSSHTFDRLANWRLLNLSFLLRPWEKSRLSYGIVGARIRYFDYEESNIKI